MIVIKVTLKSPLGFSLYTFFPLVSRLYVYYFIDLILYRSFICRIILLGSVKMYFHSVGVYIAILMMKTGMGFFSEFFIMLSFVFV